MLIVSGLIEVAAEDRAAFLHGRAEVIKETRGEAGCLEYCFSADSLEDGVIRVFERWSDADALSVHLGVVAERARTAPNPIPLRRREFVRYQADDGGPLGS